jgi:ABC-type microcin C transport system permease subunit YejB
MQGTWGGSGGNGDRGYREKTPGANGRDKQIIKQIAKEFGIDRDEFSKSLNKIKSSNGMGNSDNFCKEQLR